MTKWAAPLRSLSFWLSPDSPGLSDEDNSSEVFLTTDSEYSSSVAQSTRELDLLPAVSYQLQIRGVHTPFLLLTVLASILAAGCAADRRRGEQTRAHERLRQRLHPAEPSDRAAAGHREENGALHPHQQSGVPVSRLHANHAHQSEVLDTPLLLRPLLLRAPPRAGAHPIRGQRRPATLRRLPSPAVPQHTESLPTIPHRLTQRHQCQSECECVCELIH